jgi:hypothetical protein
MVRKPIPKKVEQDFWTQETIYRVLSAAGALGLVIIVLATIFSGPSRAVVTGKVSYQGKPLVWGQVILVGADGKSASGQIEQDGTYRVEGAPIGPVSVGVVSHDPLVQHWAKSLKTTRVRPTANIFATAPPVDRRHWFPVPQHYEEPGSSGITLTLKSGSNENDIILP